MARGSQHTGVCVQLQETAPQPVSLLFGSPATMEAPEVPVGSLIDFGTEPPTSPPLEAAPSTLQDPDGSLGDGASESETTESADSENDMGESPSHPSWDQDRRSSSNESFSSNQSADSAPDEETLALREFMRSYVEKIFSGG